MVSGTNYPEELNWHLEPLKHDLLLERGRPAQAGLLSCRVEPMGEIPEVCGSLDEVTVLWSGMILSIPRRVCAATGCAALHVFHQVPVGLIGPTVFMGQGNTVFIMQGKKRSRNFSWAKLDIVVSRTLVGIGCGGLRCQWQQQGVCRGVLGLSCSAPAQP